MEVFDCDGAQLAHLLQLYPRAFPDEDLRPLLTRLMGHPGVLNLCIGAKEEPSGHVAFSLGQVAGRKAALLGPLAVDPAQQKSGLGAALVRAGLDRLRDRGVGPVLVLGDPAYYGRFGFRADPNVTPPYPLPDAYAPAWQSLSLTGQPVPQGQLTDLPDPWRQPALWSD